MINCSLFNPLRNWLIVLPREKKFIYTAAVDFVSAVFSLWSAFSLRLSELYVPSMDQLWVFLLAPVLVIMVYAYFNLYQSIIRYISFRFLWLMITATAFYALLFSVIALLSGMGAEDIPRTVYGINGLVLLLVAGSIRLGARWWLSNGIDISLLGDDGYSVRETLPVIVYGAGASGVQIALALKLGHEFNPVAFVDDDKNLHDHFVSGLHVYPFSKLDVVIEKYHVRNILLAMPSVARSRRQEIILQLEPYALHVRTLPGLMDLAKGTVEIEDIQEVDIGDLLGRNKVAPNEDLLHANITNKVVMVTGAGGSIGSELCRQIVRLKPEKIVLFELNEFFLYEIEKELRHQVSLLGESIDIYPLLGSVYDKKRLEKICCTFSVKTIYHAAAYKHVPMVESNVTEAIRNNIFGTLHCAEAAIASEVETFVLISTDKAVRPTNTMGASKRFAELVLQGLAQGDNSGSTRFTMVRFGNVLGSSGSVVPLFREQIKRGGPVTVTDAKIIRYFMTIPEAAELVIQAGAMGVGGDVFVLDMGEPIKILDLAKKMIHLSGFDEKDDANPKGDIEIVFTGLRPGEKLYEELLIGDNVYSTEHQKVMRAEEHVIDYSDLCHILEDMKKANEDGDCVRVREIMMEHVSGFKPQCGIEDLLCKS